jgi:hypothetical protein
VFAGPARATRLARSTPVSSYSSASRDWRCAPLISSAPDGRPVRAAVRWP